MKNSFNYYYGKVLKQLRDDLDLTQEELAFRCSLQTSYISSLERERKKPGFNTICALAKGLELMPSELLRKIEEHSGVRHGDGSSASKFSQKHGGCPCDQRFGSHHTGGKNL